MSVINALLALTMVLVAWRSEANCASSGPNLVTQNQTIENCAEMAATFVDPEDSAATRHSDEQQAGMCHLGCPILFKAADAHRYTIAFHLLKYLRELEVLTVGINDGPRKPPSRFG